MMEIQTFVMGPVMTNTYLLSINDKALVIDPAGKSEKVIEKLGDLDLIGILLTHGHFDHIKGVDGLYEKYHCPVYIHQDDEVYARDKYSGLIFNLSAYISCPVEYLKEGQMEIGPFGFEVIFTPGHTPGSVIYVFEDEIFTGDTLFKGSVGRTDLDGGNERQLKDSLRVFRTFEEDYHICPGHESDTYLSYELANNWFLR